MALPKITAEELGLAVPAQVIERTCVDGNASEYELELISKIVMNAKPRTIFEFGTFDGRTTINMALNSPAQTKVYTPDLPAQEANRTKYPLASVDGYSDVNYVRKSESGARYKGKQGSEKIIQLFSDSAVFDYTPYEKSIDFIFVDGSHSSDYTINDTVAALSMVKPGGIILWHDYGSVWPDVTAVLEEFAESNPRCSGIKNIENTTLAILKTA